jgi:WhiB family redox-sensing transcriptional regulator
MVTPCLRARNVTALMKENVGAVVAPFTMTPLVNVFTKLASRKEKVISMDWRSRAACLDKDPELFFPVGNTGPALLQIEEAKSVCRRCQVVDTCLQWAIESGQDAGVWGGMSEDERRALKRRNARAKVRTA